MRRANHHLWAGRTPTAVDCASHRHPHDALTTPHIRETIRLDCGVGMARPPIEETLPSPSGIAGGVPQPNGVEARVPAIGRGPVSDGDNVADEPENLTLVYLRRMDAKVDGLAADLREVRDRLTAVEIALPGIRRDIVRRL